MDTSFDTSELLINGMTALKNTLGIVDAERFISIILRDQADYTKWREEFFDKISIDDIRNDIKNFGNSNQN